MPEENNVRWDVRRLSWQAALGVSLIAFAVTAAWFLTSAHFVNFVRGRIVSRLEEVTGGRVELSSLRWNLARLTFDLDDVTIHGLEGPNEVPYAHVDHVGAQVTVLSWWRRDFYLRALRLDRPVFHLIVQPDGTTNQPIPRIRRGEDANASVESLLRLAVSHAELHDGLLLVNDRATPLDLRANDVTASLEYDRGAARYDLAARAGKIDTVFRDYRPVSAVVDAQLSMFSRKLAINSLNISTGRSQVHASGELRDFNAPQVSLTYTARVDVAEVGAISRTPELRGGVADLNGGAEYKAGVMRASGQVKATGFDYDTGSTRLRGVVATTDFRITKERISLANLVGHTLGGIVVGEVTIDNWASFAPPAVQPFRTAKTKVDGEQRGSARLRLSGLRASQVAAMLASKSVPLQHLGLAGTASGTVDVAWRGRPHNIVAQIASEVTPDGEQGRLPVRATIRATYYHASGVIGVREFDGNTPASHLAASGTLKTAKPDSSAELKVALTTADLGEFQPLVAAMNHEALPIDLHGKASFVGNVAGTLKNASVAGDLQISDFESVIAFAAAPPAKPSSHRDHKVVRTASAPPAAKPVRMHWDSASARVQYSPAGITITHGALRQGTAVVNVDGTASLTKGSFFDTSPFSVNVRLRDVPASLLIAMAGASYPVSATVNFTGSVAGTEQAPVGGGRLVLTNVAAYGEKVQQVAADLRFANHVAQFANVDVAENGSHLLGSATYNVSTTEYRFTATANGVNLGKIQAAQARLPVQGILSLTASGAGTRDAPSFNAKVRLRNVTIRGERFGDVDAEAATAGETMHITARSDFQNSDLDVDGTVRLRDDFPAEFRATVRHLDFDPLVRSYVRGRLTGHSTLAGTLTASGPLRTPRLMTARGELTQLAMEPEHVPLQNEGPIEFSVEREVLTVRRLHLRGPDTNVDATGTVALTGAHTLDLRSDGKVSLKLLQSIHPDYVAYGMLTVTARVRGTMSQPDIRGRVQVANAGISYIDLPNGLSEMNGTIVFNKDRAQVTEFTARTGGGVLQIGGFVTYTNGVAFNLEARARDFRLRYPPGVSAMADADLRLNGTPKNALLSGDVTVTRFGVNPRFDFALYLARSKQSPEIPDPNSPLNNLKVDVHVVSTPQLQVQTSLAKISGNADLHIRGTATHPAVLGRVSIIEGDVFFNGTKYHLERGDVVFTNPVRIEPVVDLEARTTVRNYEITLGFHGPLDKLSTTYRSDPPLASNDIMSLLAFGRTREDSAAYNSQQLNITESASNEILSQALNSAVTSRVQKLFGVTRVKIDPRVGGAETNSGTARVTIEQQVANNVTLTYITDLTRSTQQVIQVEYNVNRNVSLVAVRNEYGVFSLDVRVRQRKR